MANHRELWVSIGAALVAAGGALSGIVYESAGKRFSASRPLFEAPVAVAILGLLVVVMSAASALRAALRSTSASNSGEQQPVSESTRTIQVASAFDRSSVTVSGDVVGRDLKK